MRPATGPQNCNELSCATLLLVVVVSTTGFSGIFLRTGLNSGGSEDITALRLILIRAVRSINNKFNWKKRWKLTRNGEVREISVFIASAPSPWGNAPRSRLADKQGINANLSCEPRLTTSSQIKCHRCKPFILFPNCFHGRKYILMWDMQHSIDVQTSTMLLVLRISSCAFPH